MILCNSDIAKTVDRAVFPNAQGGPQEHSIAAKAVAFGEAMRPEFIQYQKSIRENAKAMAEGLRDGGIRLVSGGTDNHMVLVDVTPLDITGRQAEESLERVNIVVNRNAIPFDPRPPRIASGLRIGSPAVTSRGFGVNESRQIAQLMIKTLTNIGDENIVREIRDSVGALTSRFLAPGVD